MVIGILEQNLVLSSRLELQAATSDNPKLIGLAAVYRAYWAEQAHRLCREPDGSVLVLDYKTNRAVFDATHAYSFSCPASMRPASRR